MATEPQSNDQPTQNQPEAKPPSDPKTPEARALTVPLNDDGSIGKLPPELQKHITAEIAKVIKSVRADAANPVVEEKLKQLEEENERFKLQEAERSNNYEEATKLRETKFQARERELLADIERRTQRLADMALSEVKAAALKHGAREDSLEDIAVLLSGKVAVDEKTLDTLVIGEDGKPVEGGTIEALVKDWLEAKPIFRKPPQSGGGARGGYSVTTGRTPGAQAEEAEYDAAMSAWKTAQTTENMNRVRLAKLALNAKRSAA